MSDTLVIHPKDDTTFSLKYIYINKGYDLIDDPNISREALKEEIRRHRRIIMLGHGNHMGLAHPDLIRYGRVMGNAMPFIIDDSFANLLRTKITISVWCKSDEYFIRNNIPGFHTGMIISEVSESILFLGSAPLNQGELYANATVLAKAIGECIDMSPLEMKEYVLNHYTGSDPVTRYNRNNIKVI